MNNAKSTSSLSIPAHWQSRFYRVAQMRYVVIFLFVALSFIAWNRGLALLYGMVALLLAALVISVVLPRVYLARLRASLLPIAPVHAGDEQPISLNVSAPKPTYGITLQLPFSVPPDEAEQAPIALSLAWLPSHPYHSSQMHATKARGYTLIDTLEARCAYPFGIFQWRKTLRINAVSHTVYPRLITIRSLPAQWLTGASQNDAHPQQQQHGNDLFIGLRDYRYGDHYRRIDWRASARAGDIKVREFEQLEQPSFLIIVNADTTMNVGDGERNAFEHSLSLAASLATFALRQGYHTVVAGACRGRIASSQQLTDFYQQLAELSPQSRTAEPHYTERVNDALAEHARVSVAVSFSLEPLASTPSHQQNHWQCVFDKDSYLKPLMRARSQPVTMQGNRRIIPIRANDNLERLFNGSP